ncbi:MAG TPA: c-type cytochrome [Beijerinckiaceae bacterium]|jgi:cytochrome c-L
MAGSRLRLFGCCVGLAVLGWEAMAEPVVFRHALDNAPLEVKPRPNEVETEAVKSFKETGKNPYIGDEQALAEGKRLYQVNCQACHLPDGSGRIGPSLIDDTSKYPRGTTDVGMFEILYGGASGAMQSFARRGMTQDQMLKVIAYVRSLKK